MPYKFKIRELPPGHDLRPGKKIQVERSIEFDDFQEDLTREFEDLEAAIIEIREDLKNTYELRNYGNGSNKVPYPSPKNVELQLDGIQGSADFDVSVDLILAPFDDVDQEKEEGEFSRSYDPELEPGEEPPAPASLANYVVDPVQRQDPGQLRDLARYAELLAAHKEKISKEKIEQELPDDESLEQVIQEGGSTSVIKKVPCGKECNGCPHGPYRYEVQRSGDGLEWTYIGPV